MEGGTGDMVGVTAPVGAEVVPGIGVGAAEDWAGDKVGTPLEGGADVGEGTTVGPSGVVPEPGFLPGDG